MPYLIIVIWLAFQSLGFCMGPKVNWEKAIDGAIHKYGLAVEPQLISYFNKASIHYPPKEIALLTFKSERKMELWARDERSSWTYIHLFPLKAYSGSLGPKLKENDGQIPEGIYKLVSFNPFSSWHLSMMINYPNQFDKQKGRMEGRKKLGNNIFLHGKSLSAGCLAVGNKAIDQLFTLARRVGLKNIQVIIAPNDIRHKKPLLSQKPKPVWLPELYSQIKMALKPFNNKLG